MKEKILIVGAGGFGRITLEHAIRNYDCFFVDDYKKIGDEINGIRVVGKTKDLSTLFAYYKKIVIAIGNNFIRKEIYKTAKEIGYEFPNVISTSAYVSPFSLIGEGCIVLNNVVIQNGAKVGNLSLLNPGVELHCDAVVGSFCCIYSNSVIRTNAFIESFIKIGSNVTIKNNTIVKIDIEDGEVV